MLIMGGVDKFRHFFFRWKNYSLKEQVVDINENEDGPTNLQCMDLRLRCLKLAEMM